MDHLPTHILSTIFSLASLDDQRQLRLVCKSFYHATTCVVRSLRPSHLPHPNHRLFQFSGLHTIDFTLVTPPHWSETFLATLTPATHPSLSTLRFAHTTPITSLGAGIIASLTQLRSIEVLDAPCITDAVLTTWTSSLPHLTSLSLLGCQHLTPTGLSTVSCLKNLQVVELGSCPGVNDAVLIALASLDRLEKLDISSCEGFSEVGLQALGGTTKTGGSLKFLSCSACWHVDDAMLISLCTALPALETLSLFEAGEGVTDHGMAHLSKLQSLTGLDLGYSCWGHTSAGLQAVVASLPVGLKMLNIGGAEGVTDSVLHTVTSRLTGLTMLDVSECQRVGGEGWRGLGALGGGGQLHKLHLGWNFKLNDATLGHLPPSLTALDLSYCSDITLGTLRPGTLPLLAHCQIRRCTQVNDTGLRCLIAAAPCLRHLDLSYCPSITSSALPHLSSLSRLSSLSLSGCPRAATVLGLCSLAHCPRLTSLEACNNPRLDDGCMQALSFVPQLRHIALRQCPRVSDHGVMAIARIAKLESLEIDGRNVSGGAVERLQARLPRLKKVYVAWKDLERQIVEYYHHHHHGGGGGGVGGDPVSLNYYF